MISPKNRQFIHTCPYYQTCALADDHCGGRITIEHAMYHKGRKIEEMWAYVPLCEYHHAVNTYQDGGDLQKEKNQWIALNNATDAILSMYERVTPPFVVQKERLNKKYGIPEQTIFNFLPLIVYSSGRIHNKG